MEVPAEVVPQKDNRMETLECGGGQEMYELIVQGAKDAISNVGESRANQRIGGFTVDELREGATDPVRGLWFTEFTSPFRKGQVTYDQMLDNMEAGKEWIQGLETPDKVARAKAAIEAEQVAAGKEPKAGKDEIRARWLAEDFKEIVDAARAGELKNKGPKYMQGTQRMLTLKGIASEAQGQQNVTDRLILRSMEEIDAVVYDATVDAGKGVMEIAAKYGFNEKSKDADALGRAAQYWNVKNGQTIEDFAASDIGRQILAGAKKPAEMLEFLREAQVVTEKLRVRMDRIDKLFGGEGVAVLDDPNAPGYLTKINKQRRAINIPGRLKDAWQRDGGEGNAPRRGPVLRRNPFAEEREKTGDKNRDWNFFRAFDQYVKEAGSQNRTISIHHNEMIAEVLRNEKLNDLADGISAITQRHMNNTPFAIEAEVNGWMESTPFGRVAAELLGMNKRRFDNTRYRGNPAMPEAQSRSLPILFTRNPIAAIKAIPDLFDPAIWRANAESQIARIKNTPHGGRKAGESSSDVGEPSTLLHQGKVNKATDVILDKGIRDYEGFTTQLGLNVSRRRIGDTTGMSAREVADAANDYAKLTQQQYDVTGTAPMMNTTAIKGTAVALRYRVDSHLGQVLEIWSKSLGDRYEGGKWNHKKLIETGRVLAGITMADTISLATKGYGSVGGIGGLILWDIITGEESGYTGQAKAASLKVIRHFINGEYSEGLGLIFEETTPLGRFANRIKDTKEAWDSGEITNPWELPWSAIHGVQSTASGRSEKYGGMFDDPFNKLPVNPNAAEGLNLPQMIFYGGGNGTGSPRPSGGPMASPPPRPTPGPKTRPQAQPAPRRTR